MHQSAKSLLQQLRLRDETTVIEAKKASAIGSSVMQTVCAFSNEPGLGGGYLLLGVAEPDTQHDQFYVCGVENSAKLLSDLQTNCRSQFEQPIHIQAEVVSLEGKTVIQVFIPELQPAAKPCTFDGKFDRSNKRKTGVWRRGIDGDYECAQQEIEPILLAKTGLGFEQVVLPDAGQYRAQSLLFWMICRVTFALRMEKPNAAMCRCCPSLSFAKQSSMH